jgi:O-antigen ligase
MSKRIKHIAQFVWLIPIAMVLGTVVVVNPLLGNGLVAGKYFHFYLSMGILGAVMMVFQFICRSRFRFGMMDWLLLLYGAATLIISCFIHHSEATTKHVLLLLVIVLYFYFRIVLSGSGFYRYWLVLFLIVGGLVEAYLGLLQLYGFEVSQHARFRLTGSFFNPGPYACYLAVVLPCAFHSLLRDWDCTKVKFHLRCMPIYFRWGVSALTCVGIVLILPASMSRTAWMAGAVACGAVVFLHFRKEIGRFFKGRCKVVLLLIIALCAGAAAGMYHIKKDSADGRALIWKISLQVAVRHPFGVGIGQFPAVYGEAQSAYFEAEKGTEQEQRVAGNPEYGFNEYLQIAIEQGVVPLALFLCILGYSLYKGFKRRKTGATASLLSLLFVAVSSYPFSVLPFLIVMSLLLAMINDRRKPHFDQNSPSISSRVALPIFVLLCGISILLWICCTVRPTYQAYRSWGQLRWMYQSGAYEICTKAYSALEPQLSDQLDFLFEYAQSLSKTRHYNESNRILGKAARISCDPMLYNVMGKNHQAMRQYEQAEQCLLKAAHIVPNRMYPWYLLALLYEEQGDIDKAKAMARIVLTKEPKVQSTAIREMRERMKKIL